MVHFSGKNFVICLSGFFAQFIIEGIMLSFVVYSPILVEHFDTTISNITLMGSMACGLWFMISPLASILTSKYGYMIVEIWGGVLCTIGCVGTSLAAAPWIIIVFFGVIFGFGAGLGFLPAISAAPTHFKDRKWRHFVATVITVGGAAGGIFFPLLLQLLLDHYPWQFGFCITGAITMQLIVCGAVFSLVEMPEDHKLVVIEAPRIAVVLDDDSLTMSDFASNCPKSDTTQIDTSEIFNTYDDVKEDVPKNRTNLSKHANDLIMHCKEVPNKKHILMFFLNCFAWNLGYFVWFAALPLFLAKEGCTERDITSLYTYMGISIVIGRIATALFVVICPNTDKLVFYSIVSLISGLTIALFIIRLGYSAYVSYSVIYGLLFGAQTAIMPSVSLQLVGIRYLNTVLSLILPASGLGGFIGPALAGGILDRSGSYEICFGVASGFIVTSFLTLLPSHFIAIQYANSHVAS